MKKFKVIFDLNKETRWLNDMSDKGYVLRKKGFLYEFEESKDIYSIRYDFRTFYKKSDYHDFIMMFKDSGWELISGSFWTGSYYFKKLGINEDIYSDEVSKIAFMKRHASFWMIYSIFLVLVFSNYYHEFPVGLKELYLTPGLWESEGFGFWRAFLFETPFAFMRFLSVYGVFIVSGIYLLYTFAMAKQIIKSRS